MHHKDSHTFIIYTFSTAENDASASLMLTLRVNKLFFLKLVMHNSAALD